MAGYTPGQYFQRNQVGGGGTFAGGQPSSNYNPLPTQPWNPPPMGNEAPGPPGQYQWDPRTNRYIPQQSSPSAQRSPSETAQGQEEERFQQGSQLFDTAIQSLRGLGAFGFNGGTYNFGAPNVPMGIPPSTTPPTAIPPTTNPVSGPNAQQLKSAQDAAYADARDKAANTETASMRGLQQALAARGVGGAGYEAGEIGNVLANAANQTGAAYRQFTGDQYKSALERANLADTLAAQERGQDVAAGTAAGQQNVEQRGQTIGQQVATGQQGVEERGQTIAANEEQARLALQARFGLLNALKGINVGGVGAVY